MTFRIFSAVFFTAVWPVLWGQQREEAVYVPLGTKLAFTGDGHQGFCELVTNISTQKIEIRHCTKDGVCEKQITEGEAVLVERIE